MQRRRDGFGDRGLVGTDVARGGGRLAGRPLVRARMMDDEERSEGSGDDGTPGWKGRFVRGGERFGVEDSDDDYDTEDVWDVELTASVPARAGDPPSVMGRDDASGLTEKLSIELRTRGVEADMPKLAAPGLLQQMRDERRGPLGRFGGSTQIGLALVGSVLIWNVPKCVAHLGGFLANAFPGLGPVVAAVKALRGMGVGFNPGVCAACTTATFKIVALCVVVGRLMRAGKLPRDTPVVLSKLAFNLLLPTYMCTRVAATLNSTPLTLSLAALPVSAVLFVLLGGALGAVIVKTAAAVPGWYKQKRWHPTESPAGSAADIAEAAAGAVGIPGGGFVMNPAGRGGARRGEEEAAVAAEAGDEDQMARIGVACCAFGNTFTLPLVFLVEVLGPAYADRVAGYIALYLIGWSPALWTVGYMLLTGGSSGGRGGRREERGDGGRGASLKEKLVAAKETAALIVRETINPPLVGICTGVLIGVTPLRHYLIGGSAAHAAAVDSLPPELSLVAAATKALFELAVLIGGAALPGQTLVLASSFVKIKTPEEEEAEASEALSQAAAAAVAVSKGATRTAAGSGGGASWFGIRKQKMAAAATAAGNLTRRFVSSITSFLALSEADARALVIAALVRFGALPAAGVVMALALKAVNSPWYPVDPVVALVVLTMLAMPPAQNLVLLTNLKEETRNLAPRLAGLLLRMYVLAIPPTTVWLTVFMAAVGGAA